MSGSVRLWLCRTSVELRTIHASGAPEGSLLSRVETLCGKPVSEAVANNEQPRNTIACLECVMRAALIVLRAAEIDRRST